MMHRAYGIAAPAPVIVEQRCHRTEFDVWSNDGPAVWHQDAAPTTCSVCGLPPECHDY